MVMAERLLILRQQQIDHQANDFTRGEVLTWILVQRFVEFADQFLEDIAHLKVRYFVRVKVDILEFLHHQEEETGFIKFGDGIVKVKFFQDFTHVIAESIDVSAQVSSKVRCITEQPLEIVEGGVVEGITGRSTQLRGEIIQLTL